MVCPSRVLMLLVATLTLQILLVIALPLPSTPIQNLAFGSCNAHNRDQSIWRGIVDAKPDVFVWLGDVVYADTPAFPLIWTSTPIDKMRAKFEAQKTSSLYSELRNQTPIVGVWDDHDYGKNNGGAEYADKMASQTIFMDFLDEPEDSPRRRQPGIYTSYYLPGAHSDQEIHLILLDVRYHKTGEMGTGDMLGEAQWEWLERTLRSSPSRFHIIGSGIQVTPFQKPVQEAWSSHPQSRQRLFDLFTKLRTPGVILLSGDVHYSEVLKVPERCSGTGYPIYEFTSSGLTHTCNGMLGNCEFFLNHFFKTQYHHNASFYAGLNWGSLQFDWTKNTLALHTHGVNGNVVNTALIPFDEIAVPSHHPMDPEKSYGALSACDGPPNWFMLIPFERYKYVLYLVPISALVFLYIVARFIYRYLSKFGNKSVAGGIQAKNKKGKME